MSDLNTTRLAADLNVAKLTAIISSKLTLNDYLITVEDIDGGHRLTVTKNQTAQYMDIMDGISPTIKVERIYNGHRVTITDADGDKSFDVMNGSGGGPEYTIGHGLLLDEQTYTLSVNTATEPEPDNTLPITSAAVYTSVGNINALLETI